MIATGARWPGSLGHMVRRYEYHLTSGDTTLVAREKKPTPVGGKANYALRRKANYARSTQVARPLRSRRRVSHAKRPTPTVPTCSLAALGIQLSYSNLATRNELAATPRDRV